MVLQALLRAAEIMGQLLDADAKLANVIGEVDRDELAELLPLLGLEQFDRQACNKAPWLLHDRRGRGELVMKLSVQIVVHPDTTEGSPVVREVFALDREGLAPTPWACN